MKKDLKYILLICAFTLSISYANKIAVATKIKGLVETMPAGKRDFIKLKPGTILSDGDKVRTDSKGFAAIIFIDDKSTLKLKENSEAIITGQRSAASISKKINMVLVPFVLPLQNKTPILSYKHLLLLLL